jgi:hypothetical protein
MMIPDRNYWSSPILRRHGATSGGPPPAPAGLLRGAKSAVIPVEQPTKFDMVINVKTAKGLGPTVPGTVLARADDVIE